jgi:hypothetical protein
MNDQTERAPSQPYMKTAADEVGKNADPTYNEVPEIRGWALQWDTTELRRTNLARKMRHLRQTSSDQ